MNHLTDEQLEDVLKGRASVPEHLEQCLQCRTRLEVKHALAQRMRRVFAGMQASPDLGARIRAGLAGERPRAQAATSRRTIALRAHRRIWTGLAVAAAILVVVLPRGLHLNLGPQTTAAQTALANIHFVNLDSLNELMADAKPAGHCPCTDGQLDDGVVMPCCKRGLCLCGCRMRDFEGRPVESCVIQEPNATVVSVVMVPKSPQALGMTPAAVTTVTGQTIWQARCKSCNMASVRMGENACCVVGQVPPEELVALLNAFER